MKSRQKNKNSKQAEFSVPQTEDSACFLNMRLKKLIVMI